MTETAPPVALVGGAAPDLLESAFQSEGRSVFGPIAEQVGLAGVTITMRGLQLLYWLRSQHPLTRLEMVQSISAWRGTGRNDVVPFEPAGSAAALLDRMEKDELLLEMGSPQKRFLASPKGIALLSRLHPACEDLDLPWRLARWAADWPGSRQDVERYVRSAVTRQRFFAAAV